MGMRKAIFMLPLRPLKLLLVVTASLLVTASCQAAPPRPSPTAPPASPTTAPTAAPPPATPTPAAPTPAPTPTPTPEVIAPENATRIKETGHIEVPSVLKLVWSLQGDSIAAVSTRSVSLYNPQSLQLIRSFSAGADQVLDFSADGRTVAVGKANHEVVDLINVFTGSVVRTLQPGVQFVQGIFSPDGQNLALTLASQIAVELWDTATGREVRRLTGFQTAAPVYGVAFAPDGLTLIWKARATVQLMNVATGQLGPEFRHEDFVASLAVTPDGKTLATAVAAQAGGQLVGTIKLWDAQSGNEITTLTQSDGTASAMTFSPDGRLLAAASGKQIELWDTATRTRISNLTGHAANVSSLAFSPDGLTLASAGADGMIRFWQVLP